MACLSSCAAAPSVHTTQLLLLLRRINICYTCTSVTDFYVSLISSSSGLLKLLLTYLEYIFTHLSDVCGLFVHTINGWMTLQNGRIIYWPIIACSASLNSLNEVSILKHYRLCIQEECGMICSVNIQF